MASNTENSEEHFGRLASPIGQFAVCVFFAGLLAISLPTALDVWTTRERGLIIAFSGIGLWRWGWGGLHVLRAFIYRFLYYPILRKRARRAVSDRGPISDVRVISTTYFEDPWITAKVVHAIVREFRRLKNLKRPPLLVFVTGDDSDDVVVRREFQAAIDREPSGGRWPPQLVLLRGDRGKRPAIVKALRYVATSGVGDDTAIVLMDGDSLPESGSLVNSLPLLRLSDNIGALTTNERALVEGPSWFSEWITLRFGQRHIGMCSVSLSRRVLCLTGRFSVFRGDVATNPSFIDQLENDTINHWLFGTYQMFSGDDKSTWYWLSKHGYEMLYAPDAMVTTFEVIENKPFKRAVANLVRWSGNTLRCSGRAIRLGPFRLGFFPWLCTVDQRISMWSSLIGPTSTIWAIVAGRYHFVACYVVWLIASRCVRVIPSCLHSRRISPFYLLTLIASDWVNAIIKVWINFHPVKQSWINRGNRTVDSTKSVGFRRVRHFVATYAWAWAVAIFLLCIGAYQELAPIFRDFPLVTHASAGQMIGSGGVSASSDSSKFLDDALRHVFRPTTMSGTKSEPLPGEAKSPNGNRYKGVSENTILESESGTPRQVYWGSE